MVAWMTTLILVALLALAPSWRVYVDAASTMNVATQPRVEPFQIYTDDFWLNLHQFLYALGVHEAGLPTRTRRAIVNAPVESQAALDRLTPQERAQWAGAVRFYAAGPSARDLVFDRDLVRITDTLTALRNTGTIPPTVATTLGREWSEMLMAAAPIYRRVWWPAHQRANHTRREAMLPLASRHAPTILPVLARAFGQPWPSAGFPVHLAGYAGWAGAYSTGDNLLIVSSQDTGNAGLLGLETLFHEAAHQWDETTATALKSAAATAGTTVPPNLSHALIFFTAGAAVRAVEPAHRPYADENLLWPRLGAGLKAALDAAWQPFLDGRGTREEALVEVLRHIARTTLGGSDAPGEGAQAVR